MELPVNIFLILNIALFIVLIYALIKIGILTKSQKIKELGYLEKAQRKAGGLIEDALEKGEGILEKAEYFKDSLSEQANKSLEESAKENIEEFDKKLSQLSGEAVESMKRNLNSLEEITKKRMEEMMVKAQGEIEQYKQNKIASIDEGVAQKVSELGLKLFGKSIPLDEQDELVIRSLEAAKKEGIL